jgi:hypothetical protein
VPIEVFLVELVLLCQQLSLFSKGILIVAEYREDFGAYFELNIKYAKLG